MMSSGANQQKTIAVSISESPDVAAYGLSHNHLQETMGTIAIYVLARGARLAYGGDLRHAGFTDFLIDVIGRHRRPADSSIRVTDYLAWPVHMGMENDAIRGAWNDARDYAQLALLDMDGRRISLRDRLQMKPAVPRDNEWSTGLTAMRRTVCAETDARVVLGGKVEGYRGIMPGIAEEVLISLETKQPVFLIGGFGGCVRGIAETLGLVAGRNGPVPEWSGRDSFVGYDSADLRNGLVLEENELLAGSPHTGQIISLILRGLNRLQAA